jgi:hypothetical protein
MVTVSFEKSEGSMVLLAIANEVDPVRKDPHFKELLQRMNLPQLS